MKTEEIQNLQQENTKPNGNKRRLLLLILLLVCTLTLLGSATYAWFTANTKVAIESMDLEVTVANGIEISADAENWSQMILQADLYQAAGVTAADLTKNGKSVDAGSVNQFPAKLKNVSTIGNVGTTNNRLDLFNGTASTVCYKDDGIPDSVNEDDGYSIVNNDEITDGIEITECDPDGPRQLGLVRTSVYEEGTKACVGTAGESGCDATVGVYAFDVYLKLDNNSDVYLAPGSYVKNISDTDYGLKNTIRMAFVTLGNQPSDFYYAEEKDIDAEGKVQIASLATEEYYTKFGGYAGVYGARQMNGFGKISIWEPNSKTHTKSALTNAANNYGDSTTKADTEVTTHGIYKDMQNEEGMLPLTLDLANGNDNGDFFAEQKLVTTESLAEGGDNVGKGYTNPINYFKTAEDELGTGQKIFTGRAGVTKVRVYIWVEGNDIDTENTATSSLIQARLSFTTSSTGTPTEIKSENTDKYTNILPAVFRTGAEDTLKAPSVTGTATPIEAAAPETTE